MKQITLKLKVHIKFTFFLSILKSQFPFIYRKESVIIVEMDLNMFIKFILVFTLPTIMKQYTRIL